MVNYPTAEEIVEANAVVVAEINVRKADKHEVLSKSKIEEILENVKAAKGDLFDKAVVLLKGLVQKHPFASGNRRTAFAVVENFLRYNGEKAKINKASNPRIMQGIREDYYSDGEIKMWLKGGDMREFKR